MRRLLNILALLAIVSFSTGCSGVRDIKVTSCVVKSISLNGLKAVTGVLALGIDNPIMGFTISDLNGVINRNGEEFATFHAGRLPVTRKSTKVYPLSCNGAISRNVGLMELMRIAGSKDFSDMTVDMSVKIKLKCGIGKTLHFKEIKITDLMEPSVAAAYLELIINEMMV